MTRKIYRTAQGKLVDLGRLQLQNEGVRAVGNMGVNARGDIIDSQNKAIDTRNKQVARQYNRQTTNVVNEPVTGSHRKNKSPVNIPPPPEDFDDEFDKTAIPTTNAEPQSSGGLAAAIARARQIKQEPLKTPRDIEKYQQK